MSLRAIVETFGGELYAGGRRANIPAPGHSAQDRSISLLLEGDRVIVHSFGGEDWKVVLDQLREHRLIDDANLLLTSSRHPAPSLRSGGDVASVNVRIDVARRLWDAGRPLEQTLAARHVRSRGVARPPPGPEALRFHIDMPVAVYRPGRVRRPAMMAGIRDPSGRLTAVEVTYLAANARRAFDLRLPRKMIGATPPGCAVQLDSAEPEILVGEGVFTTLSATEWFGLPGWALLSTRNLRSWSPPEGVRSVLIAGDRGRDGEASAEKLRFRLLAAGLAATVALPPAPWGDWNEWANRADQQVSN